LQILGEELSQSVSAYVYEAEQSPSPPTSPQTKVAATPSLNISLNLRFFFELEGDKIASLEIIP
jgi:hypothetical protein